MYMYIGPIYIYIYIYIGPESKGALYLVRLALGLMKIGSSLARSKSHMDRIGGASARTFFGLAQAFNITVRLIAFFV